MRSWLKPTRTEWITFLVLMPVIDTIVLYIMFDQRLWAEARLWFYAFPIGYAVGFVTFYVNVIVMHWFQQLMPGLKQTPKRVLLIVCSHIAMTAVIMSLVFWAYDAFALFEFSARPGQFRSSAWAVIGMVMLTTTLWESEFIYKNYKESLIEKETMQQMSIEQEFETLKNQVNPHFLFNCFNTLSSLISEDRQQAENFLNELSKVYRYLLRNNEDGLSTLQEELNFIQSYYKLLTTRHGEAIRVQTEVDKKYSNYVLPSLSLQLLVENAVKHNVISKSKPLLIDIFSMAGNKLAVNNNLQRKMAKVPSNRIGLSNIRLKYELLKCPGFEVLEDEKNFTVVLPLIWNNAADKMALIQKNASKITLN